MSWSCEPHDCHVRTLQQWWGVVGVFWIQRDTSKFSQLDLMLRVSLGSCLQLSDSTSTLRCPCRVRLGGWATRPGGLLERGPEVTGANPLEDDI